ncbi:ArsR/SmtB family transcription factor [Bacillus sp. PS06]|uniref:ArsR/SmtB family transcription factor n=1 Tax=Bacillus sp. PS06 TaxID=2764176 RepID=UPI00177B6BA4|nr:ArsR family transcriptional regulator [Bacillus sp. PS06]MBD8069055.1 ArsR family transcriptional regulator [Bacillus sp. PS06]
MIHIKDLKNGLDIFKALSSSVRVEIINLLSTNERMNLNEIAEHLKLTNGAVTMHIRKLEDSGLIKITSAVGRHGIQKICYLNEDSLTVDLRKKDIEEHLYEYDIKVGHYSDYHIEPTCGLATKDSIIGEFDDPRYFADPKHIHADILWLTKGYVEYRIPNYLNKNEEFRELQFIMELGSEAPNYNHNWPSDIHFFLNNIELGYWTSPGDFGETKGHCNPSWWPPNLNQYGQLKLLRINHEGTYMDGSKISDVTIDEINLTSKSDIKFKLAVSEHGNSGGLTIFGKHFGNYEQDIIARLIYDVVK